MATIQDLGKVAYFNRGAYSGSTTYEINDVVSYNGSSYVSLDNDNRGNLPTNTTYWSVVAAKGDKGDTGKPFVIEKTYESIEEMVADYDNMQINDYVMIQGDIEDEQNATLWTKTETEVSPYKWVYLADFSGASGITGQTPNIQIGTVSEGNEPSVTRRAGSTNENPILDFVLKTGAQGETGATGNGISSISKTGTSGLVDTYTVTYTNGNSTTFTVTNGKGISSIAKTGTSGLVDTYTITYNDGSTSTYTVTNGEDGEVTEAELNEVKAENEYLNSVIEQAFGRAEGSGTNIMLEDTIQARFKKLQLNGNTSQETTSISGGDEYDSPAPDHPQDVHVVSGDNTIRVSGKNLFTGKESYTKTLNNVGITIEKSNLTLNGSSNKPDTTNSQEKAFIEPYRIEPNTQYTYSVKVLSGSVTGTRFALNLRAGQTSTATDIQLNAGSSLELINGDNSMTFTSSGTANYLTALQFIYSNDASFSNLVLGIQLEKNSTATTYEPYTGASYPVNLGVKNLFDGVFRQGNHVSTTTLNKLCSTLAMVSTNGSKYTLSTNLPNTYKWKIMNCTTNDTSTTVIDDTNYTSSGSVTVTCSANGYLKVLIMKTDDGNLTPSDVSSYHFQVEKGTKANQYTPHGTTPLELCKIGDYKDRIFKSSGVNLINDDFTTGYQIQAQGQIYENQYWNANANFFKVQPNTQYSFVALNTGSNNQQQLCVAEYSSNTESSFIIRTQPLINANYLTITTSATTQYVRVAYNNGYGVGNYMLVLGNTIPTTYGPYGAYWYKYGAIGKIVLNGSETWGGGTAGTTSTDYTYVYTNALDSLTKSTYFHSFCDKLTNYPNSVVVSSSVDKEIVSVGDSGSQKVRIMILTSRLEEQSTSGFKDWLENNNLTLYYVLAKPTYTRITDATLISQLEALRGANSYNPLTNIYQSNNDEASILDATALSSPSSSLNTQSISTLHSIQPSLSPSITPSDNLDSLNSDIPIQDNQVQLVPSSHDSLTSLQQQDVSLNDLPSQDDLQDIQQDASL